MLCLTPEWLIAGGKEEARREGGKNEDNFRHGQCPPKFILGERVMSGSEYASVRSPESTNAETLPWAARPFPVQAQVFSNQPTSDSLCPGSPHHPPSML